MAIFPTTPVPRIGSSGELNFLVITSEFEGNYSQTRRGATRGRKTFNLMFNSITDAEFTTIEAFFQANIGGAFSWTNPRNGQAYTVRFKESKLPFKYTSSQRIDTSVVLEEV